MTPNPSDLSAKKKLNFCSFKIIFFILFYNIFFIFEKYFIFSNFLILNVFF